MRTSGDKLPAAALALSTKKVWEVIRSQRDLNLPAHKVRHSMPAVLRTLPACWHMSHCTYVHAACCLLLGQCVTGRRWAVSSTTTAQQVVNQPQGCLDRPCPRRMLVGILHQRRRHCDLVCLLRHAGDGGKHPVRGDRGRPAGGAAAGPGVAGAGAGGGDGRRAGLRRARRVARRQQPGGCVLVSKQLMRSSAKHFAQALTQQREGRQVGN